MEMMIEWSELSTKQLYNLYDYCAFEKSLNIASKIVDGIIKKVSILESNPLVGSKEEPLNDYPEDYRYLVESNYKIIYWKKENLITIASVFDCRQNPTKIMKI